MKVLVTGGNGQLASSIRSVENKYPNLEFVYTDYEDLDVTDRGQLSVFFKSNSFEYCINCAAYTAVDKAEKEKEQAEEINANAVLNLVKFCKSHNVKLIQISTDFVFDGKKSKAYKETDTPNPLSIYGSTKLKGEEYVVKELQEYFVIRTSWLYSEFGNNFMKTMVRLAKERKELSIVADQIGTPTYAPDLADIICRVIVSNLNDYGVYHYSNEGVASWYDFAKAIFEISNLSVTVNPISTEQYPTPAQRPVFSVLDKKKIKNTFKMKVPYWRDSLKMAIKKYNEYN